MSYLRCEILYAVHTIGLMKVNESNDARDDVCSGLGSRISYKVVSHMVLDT